MTDTLRSRELLTALSRKLSGELHFDHLQRVLYATDASVYRVLPQAVAIPVNVEDLRLLIDFARRNDTSLLPRAAGTSLAGQCVGDGIVVDISKSFNRILEFNAEERWVRVEPGVVRDELNAFLRPHGLFFAPVTATANRATIGGMVGNNSCGTNSIVYGTTRDKLIALKGLLSDGSEATFEAVTPTEFQCKLNLNGLEGELYRHLHQVLENPKNQAAIRQGFPKPGIHRRNTGYAFDALLETSIYTANDLPFHLGKLLCGSEGTLAFTTEVKLQLDPLPPPDHVVVAAHFVNLQQSLLATQVAMQYRPAVCELMDKIILDCTKDHKAYRRHRFFLEGDPATVLMVEFRGGYPAEVEGQAQAFIADLQKRALGYAYPIVPADRTQELWTLRSAGLGLLANLPGDAKAVACIEDTAVALEDLPDYIEDFSALMEDFGQRPVYYAHAGAGELHLRPILDLKKAEDVQRFYDISLATARLVREYRGALSGEHGDGRVRATFLPLVVGAQNYELFRAIKQTWDPHGIFNPGKIVDAPPMNESLRYEADREEPQVTTLLDFSSHGGFLRAAEKCNGSGDCRKLPLSGGTMCPSYQATRNESDTTRARANALREFLTQSDRPNPFGHAALKAVMDLCISCKGCTAECPSNVDMASMKAEFLYQYHREHGIPWRDRLFANAATLNRWGIRWPRLYNFLLTHPRPAGITRRWLGLAPERTLPPVAATSLRNWFKVHFRPQGGAYHQAVFLFCDEFTNYNDTSIGRQAIELLDRLGYWVYLIDHPESGRAAISRGLLEKARRLAEQNVRVFAPLVSEAMPLLGIEPSAILSFRDEYPRLVRSEHRAAATALAPHCLLIDEFLAREIRAGRITAEHFSDQPARLLLHGHCHQKALSNLQDTIWMLSLPTNYHVEVIPSGCCGMAGGFGYEAEHYDVSQKIGELVLFPAVRAAGSETIIVANGTSCRTQICDGTESAAVHPVEVLYRGFRNVH